MGGSSNRKRRGSTTTTREHSSSSSLSRSSSFTSHPRRRRARRSSAPPSTGGSSTGGTATAQNSSNKRRSSNPHLQRGRWHNFLEEFVPPIPHRFDDKASFIDEMGRGTAMGGEGGAMKHGDSDTIVCPPPPPLRRRSSGGGRGNLEQNSNVRRRSVQRTRSMTQRVPGSNNDAPLVGMGWSDSDMNLQVYAGSSDDDSTTSSSSDGSSDSDDSSSSASSSSSSDSSSSEGRRINRAGITTPKIGGAVMGERSRSVPPNYYRNLVWGQHLLSASAEEQQGDGDLYYSQYQQRSRSYQYGDYHRIKNEGGGSLNHPLAFFAEFLGGDLPTTTTNAAATNQQQPPLVSYAEFLPEDDGEEKDREPSTLSSSSSTSRNNSLAYSSSCSSLPVGQQRTFLEEEKQQQQHHHHQQFSSMMMEEEGQHHPAMEEHHHHRQPMMMEQQYQQQQQPTRDEVQQHQQYLDTLLTTTWDQTRSSPLTTIVEDDSHREDDSPRTSDDEDDDEVHGEGEEGRVFNYEYKQDLEKMQEESDLLNNYIMSTGQSSSEDGGGGVDGSGRSGGTSISSSRGSSASGSGSGGDSSTLSSGSTSSNNAMDDKDSKGGKGSKSSYKRLMKMPYVKGKSNPVDSDDEDDVMVGIAPFSTAWDDGRVEENAATSSSAGTCAADSIETSSSAASSSLLTTDTDASKQNNASWSVAEESSSTDTSDLNMVAIRRSKNEPVRGKDDSLIQRDTTHLHRHIDKGRKRVDEKDAKAVGTAAKSPKKKKGNSSNKKAAKGGGNRANAVDTVFPRKRAYTRGSGSKGIRFRDRFMYNWDDGLYDNMMSQEETSPISLCAADAAAGIVTAHDHTSSQNSISTDAAEDPSNMDIAEDPPGITDDCTASSFSAEVYKRTETGSSLKTTSMITADSTVFSGTPTYSRHHSTTSQASAYTYSSMKSYLSQSQIRHLEDAPPELVDILNQQLRILKSRRQDILEKAKLRNKFGRKLAIDDSIQMENSIQFSLFVMKDKVEQLQDILGPLNVDVPDATTESVYSDTSGSGEPYSVSTESSAEDESLPFHAAGGVGVLPRAA